MNKLKISGEIDYRQYLARKMSLQENIRKMRQEQQEIIRELNGYAGSKQWLLDRGLSESDILLILIKLAMLLERLEYLATEVMEAVEEKREYLSDGEGVSDEWEEYLDSIESVIEEVLDLTVRRDELKVEG